MSEMISLVSVSKRYRGAKGAVTAVNGLSLKVGGGELCAIEGPSGCGKTTTLLVAGGLLDPDSGQVAIGGNNLYSMNASERALYRAKHIGFVFQQFHLVPYLSALNNILLPSLALGQRDGTARALELAGRFGLNERLYHRPAELSTGERQRTALARALYNNPGVLLADEPTGNLDSESAGIVFDTLREFTKRGGAVLLVTHDPRARSCADRTIYMKNGMISGAPVAGDPEGIDNGTMDR